MESLLEIQIQYLLLLQDFRTITNGILDKFFISSTWLGEIIIPFSFLSVMYWGINKKTGEFLLLVFGTNLYFNILLKMLACVPRPWILDERICPIKSVMPMADGYSFPSGHTAGAMSTWGGTAYCFWKNKLVRFLMIFLVCLVAFSRNYVGVHTPQDVIVSILVGIIVILSITRLQKLIDEKPKHETIFYLISMVVGTLFCIYLQVKCNIQLQNYNPETDLINPLAMKHSAYSKMGFFFGLFTGWFLERKFVKFEIMQVWNMRKFLILGAGLATMFGSTILLKHLLLNILEYRHVSAIISAYTGLFITLTYPLVIKFTNSHKD